MATLPFLLTVGFGAGAGVVMSAQKPLSRTWEPLRTRYFAALALFSLTALVPAGLALYLQYPDWSLMYLVNPHALPSFLCVLVVLGLYLLAPLLGFFVTHRQVRRRPQSLKWTLKSLGGLVLLLLVVGHERMLTVGYYDAYHQGGETVSLFRSPLFLALLIIVPAVLASFVFTVLLLRRHIEHLENLGEGNLPSPP